MSAPKIELARTDVEIAACFPVLRQLRPDLREETFVADVRSMETEGYRLVALSDPEVHAVAGYRVFAMFAMGRQLYVDDLVTDAAYRSHGYGKALLDWLLNEAWTLDCRYVNLDSGLQRADAHRFYRRHGFEDIGLHFSIPVGSAKKWTP